MYNEVEERHRKRTDGLEESDGTGYQGFVFLESVMDYEPGNHYHDYSVESRVRRSKLNDLSQFYDQQLKTFQDLGICPDEGNLDFVPSPFDLACFTQN